MKTNHFFWTFHSHYLQFHILASYQTQSCLATKEAIQEAAAEGNTLFSDLNCMIHNNKNKEKHKITPVQWLVARTVELKKDVTNYGQTF